MYLVHTRQTRLNLQSLKRTFAHDATFTSLPRLTDIVAACAPNTNAHIIKEIEQIKFGEGATGGITGRFYQEEDVTRYMGKLLQLHCERSDPMRTGLTNKVKLDVVKRALPTVGLKSLLESTLPTGTAPADDS